MCGFVGFLLKTSSMPLAELEDRVSQMSDKIQYRGPDSSGTWVSESDGLAFGHRRLAIRDLSQAGHQPMHSHSDRWIISYNGELYGLGALRAKLTSAGCQLRSASDTEILVESIDFQGIEKTLLEINGMFAFSAWDRETRTLYLARDRMGIKPLYWSQQNGNFYFTSELKALHLAPGWKPKLNQKAVSAYFQHGYIPCPLSIFENTYKLEPGTWLTIKQNQKPISNTYWSLYEKTKAGLENPLTDSENQIEEQLHDLLLDAVGSRMVSDVPLGSFLSGGIDSSLVTALMQAQSPSPVHTFSLGFDLPEFDESAHASAVAKHLGTQHTELMVRGSDALDTIALLPEHHDEPLADMSQIPTYLVSKLARPHVTVALTGDGGDEVFCGYDRFRTIESMRNLQKLSGRWPSRALGQGLNILNASPLPDILNRIPGPTRSKLHRERWDSIIKSFNAGSDMSAYRQFICFWHDLKNVLSQPDDFNLIQEHWENLGSQKQTLAKLQFVDLHTYLPDDLLTKVDRASMQVSLETRVPLIDHRVVEFGARLPNHLRWGPIGSKTAARKILYKYVPQEIIDRPKMGFSIPAAEWLRGPLRDWASELLSEQQLSNTGDWNTKAIQKRWNQHLKGTHRWHYQIWPILFYQAWAQHWRMS